MPLTSELNEAPEVTKETYPCLKGIKETGLVVLFISENIGTVVVSNEHNNLGNHSEHWSEFKFTSIQNWIENEM